MGVKKREFEKANWFLRRGRVVPGTMQAFLRLMDKFMQEEYSRAPGDLDLTEHTVLTQGCSMDDPGEEAFVDFLEAEMKLPSLGVTREALFQSVKNLRDLYDKLLVAVPPFQAFIGASPDSSEDEEEKGEMGRGGSVDENALAKLLDMQDDAGEDMLASQLGLVKPVQIAARTHMPGKCIECEDRKAVVDCNECGDEFCGVCFLALHRKGNRALHSTTPKPGFEGLKLEQKTFEQSLAAAGDGEENAEDADEDQTSFFGAAGGVLGSLFGAGGGSGDEMAERDSEVDFSIRAQFIPVRLSLKERQLLRLLQAQLAVSTYTDAIDRPDLKSNKRVHTQLLKICAFLSGLATSVDYKIGQKVLASRKWKEYETFFRKVLELGRRYKVLNPDRMRSEYGRLMYLMMDASRNEVEQLLGFDVKKPILTVALFLKQYKAERMLQDPLMEIATRAIDQMSEDGKKTRHAIRTEVQQKEMAVKKLARKYRNQDLDEDEIKWCLYSIGDNRTFLLQHRDPVQRMINYLKRYFDPAIEDRNELYSLAIYGGADGSRLTHSHEKQYLYVLQSLTLWREIINDMFRLWCLAEEDMLDPACPYTLQDTGQGLQRVQESPRVAKAMRDLLFRTQSKLGSWVGSSVVHLGDKNVPNALQFLDKYTQVARILSPLVLCLDRLPELCENTKTDAYIKLVFAGVEACRQEILTDFFKSAFDGSGADNFFDAGSCIDGRLTSAWNWCSRISDKPFYPVLKLSGFQSFDGQFEE